MTAHRLVDHLAYADAQRLCGRDALWELFDGDRERLNIAHECLDRHPRDRVAIRIAHADGRIESHGFGEVSNLASRTANWLAGRGIGAGERVAIMLEPSLAFYATLFGVMKAGAVAVPLFTAFGPDGLAASWRTTGSSLSSPRRTPSSLRRPRHVTWRSSSTPPGPPGPCRRRCVTGTGRWSR